MLARSLLLVLLGAVSLGRATHSKCEMIARRQLFELPQVSLLVDEIPGQLQYVSPEGSTISLTCNTTILGPTIWRLNGQPVQANEQNTFNDSCRTQLQILGFNTAVAGNYTCQVSTWEGIVSSQRVELQLPYLRTSFFGAQVSPHQYTVTEGQPTTLSCGNISSLPAAAVSWEKQITSTVFIQLDENSATVSGDGSLVLRNPSGDDTAKYRCIVQNNVLQAVSYGFIQVTVTPNSSPAPLQLLYHPQDTVTTLGSVAFFYCIPGGGGSSAVSVEWNYPGPQTSVVTARNNQELLIVHSVQQETAGTYSCTVGGMTYSATLTIIDPPYLTTTLPNFTNLTYGDRLEISCNSNSTAAVAWEWYFNGSRINESSSTYINSSVTLENLGTYQCFAINSAGYNQSTAILRVNVIMPHIIRPLPETLIAFTGQPFSFQCNATGAPPPVLSWVTGDLQRGINGSYPDGLLSFHDPQISDSGEYICTAMSILSTGRVHSLDMQNLSLQVIESTAFTAQSEEIYDAQVDTRAVFLCSVNHSSRVSVSFQWVKDGQPISLNNRTRIDQEQRLVIEPVKFDDVGQYQCIVTSRMGIYEAPKVRSRITNFRVLRIPVVPSIHVVTGTSPNSFEVEWSYLGDQSQVSLYLIQVQDVRASSSDFRQLAESSVNAITRVLVSDPSLKAYTEYNVRVVTMFLDGSFTYSDARVVRTKVAVPLDPPRDLNALPVDKSTIELQWKAPSMPQGPIERYIILYRGSGSNDSFAMERVGNVTQHKLKNLDSFSEYEVRVAAETEAGVGPFTTSINATFLLFTGENSAPFVQSIGFIVVVVVVVLVGLVVLIIGILLWRRRIIKKDSRKYLVRNSIHFGKGTSVGTEGNDFHLSEQAVASYFSRHKRAFSSTSPTTPRSQTMPHTTMGLENESSLGGTEHTVSTQVVSTSGHGIVPKFQRPPDYIDPPDPFAAERHRRSRSQSTYSGKSDGGDQDYIVMHSASSSTSPSVWKKDESSFNYGEDSDNSVEKATLNSSYNDCSEHDTASEYMHNSQLTGQYDMLPPAIPNNYHIPTNHGWGLPYGRSRSDGRVRTGSASSRQANGTEIRRGAVSAAGMAPMTVGQMVEERLRAQSPSEGIMSHATYV